MSSKHSQTGAAPNEKGMIDSTDPTVDDDNKSDSEYEYEYEEIEVEVDEDDEEIINETGMKVLISEVETIVPQEEKKKQETIVLKSDGSIEKLVQKTKSTRATVHQEKHLKQEKQSKRELKEKPDEKSEKSNKREMPEKSETNDKPRLGRALTSQEESILLPLLQGLLAANGSDTTKIKHENTPIQDNEQSSSNKNIASNSSAEKTDKNDSTDGSNILDELSTALNRLQSSLLEEKDVVADTRKRNTILTLVAWLKRVLQTSTTDNAEAQLFSLTELLPTELLLTKLMPQLNTNNKNDEPTIDERSTASSKRFSRQRNNRFNTVGVSKEELADARLFLQKKLLSENLATTADSIQQMATERKQTTLLGENDDDRRKSLNLQSSDLDKDIRAIFCESRSSFSKSVDTASPDVINLKKSMAPETQEVQTKSGHRRKSMTLTNQNKATADVTDSDEEDSQLQRRPSNSSINSSSKSKNKFALRKMQMKRANIIDVPKDQMEDNNSEQGFSDGHNNYKNNVDTNKPETPNEFQKNDVDRNHLPQFHVKSTSDQKFIAFLNKNAEENHSSWVNLHKTVLHVENKQQAKANNWNSKFGNIKNSFEQHDETVDSSVSPRLSKKNNFTHAPSSPFKPVQGNKPPLIPNGVHHSPYNNQSVQNKVAALQLTEKQHQIQNPLPKPTLRTHQSVPYADDQPHMHRDPNADLRGNNWQQNKPASVDSYLQNTISPKLTWTAYNPLYVPKNKQSSQSPSTAPYTSPMGHQMGSKPYAPLPPPPINQSSNEYAIQKESKSFGVPSPSEFPAYPFTSTDYTQPTCVSTFGPHQSLSPAIKNTSPVVKKTSPTIKNTILPDTSYLKSTSPPKTMPPPMLGSSRLNKQMKAVDIYSSNEYLSEPNNYYRSPNLFSPTSNFENYASSHDSRRSSQEFMATTHIMKYPSSQTATVVNKPHRQDDEQQAQHLRSLLTNTRSDKRQSDYSEQSVSPFSETNYSHVNRSYVPPTEPMRNKSNNNFISMENISTTKCNGPEQGAPLRLRNNTTFYGSHNALVSNQFSNQMAQELPNKQLNQRKFEVKGIDDKQKISAPVRLNSYGGQYIQPKVGENLDFSKPTYGKKIQPNNQPLSHPFGQQFNGIQNNIIKNNLANLNRSNTVQHQRIANFEIKRKQSLPTENTDYHESEFNNQYDSTTFSHNYLPFGALKKSKSTHTLALLQQFETKVKSPEKSTLPSYIKPPSFTSPEIEVKPKSIIKKTSQTVETKSIQPVEIKPAQQKPVQLKSIQQTSKSIETNAPIRPKTPPPSLQVHSKSASETVQSKIQPEKLEPPAITETPSSPLVEDGHIIFPGQTIETKRRVQHYAKTLNAMLNRKSIVIDDDDNDVDDDTYGVKNDSNKGVQRSKSGTLLAVPKQYESAIKKSEVLEKERTVAAYFAGNKSPQGIQRSSSQHSVHSSSSIRTVEEQKSNTVSPMQWTENKDLNVSESQESSNRTTTTTTKSAHHLKILRKQQQKQTSPNPLGKSQTLPSFNLLDESNVDDAFDDLFASFVGNK